MTECSVDGEWRSDIDIKRCGAYRYFESPHCLPLILCWSIDRTPVRIWTILEGRQCPPDLKDHIRSGGLIRAFNAAFERLGFKWLAKHWGWPEPRLEQYRCTAVEGAAMSLPRRLDKIGEALGVAAKKDKRGDKLIKLFSIPRREHEPTSNQSRAVNCTTRESIRSDDGALPESQGPRVPLWNEPRDHPTEFAEFIEYCAADVRAEQEVASRLIPLSAAEWAVYAMNERVNDRGLRIDVRSARAAIRLVEKAKAEIDREIAEVTGGAVTAVTQVARLKTWIATRGLVLPSLDKETIDEQLHGDDLQSHVRRAMELRAEGAKPSTDKIDSMLGRISRDGRARGVYLAHGAGQTGRFCVAAETLIDTPTGGRYIVNLRTGDEVISHLGNVCKIQAPFFKGVEPMFLLTGPGGEAVTATAGHQIWTDLGWRRIDECFEETPKGCFTARKSPSPVSFLVNDTSGDSRSIFDQLSYSQCDPERFDRPAGTRGAERSESFPEEDRGGQPDVRQENRLGTNPEKRSRSRMERRRLHLRTSFDRSEVTRLTRITVTLGSASYRRRQDEQRSRQFGHCYEERSRQTTQNNVWSLIPVGEREVWDVSVAGDASYVAQGIGHHNSSRGIQAHNMPKYRKCFEDAHLDTNQLFETIRTEEPEALRSAYGMDLGRPLHLISDAVRSFIWAAPGKEFLVADYSSIEGVMAAWSTGEEWELEAYRKAFAGTGPGIYELSAADMFGIPVETVTKQQRKGGKVRILSAQYATGPNGILKFARHEGIKMAPLFDGLWGAADAKRRAAAERRRTSRAKRGDPVLALHGREAWLAAELTKVSYRAQHPRVEAAWHSLEDGAIAAIRSPGTVIRPNGVIGVGLTVKHGFLWLQLPSGRCMAYGRPRLHAQVYARIPLEDPRSGSGASWSDSERMELADAERLARTGKCKIEGECKPKIIVSGTDAQSETWVRFPIFGGSLFNNLIQGMARDVLVHGMQKAEAAGLEVNLHTHDELAAEIWRNSADPEWFERLICELPPWCAGLPLNAKAFVSKRYKKD